MKHPFASDRPIVEFWIGQRDPIRLLGLVDSGAMATRVSASVAIALNIDYSDGAPTVFTAGGEEYVGATVDVPLRIGRREWNAPVCFVEGWTYRYQLLGLLGFFDRWIVRIDGAERYTQLQPSRRPPRAI